MLEGRTAFVTGASRGIGRAIATALADIGANVALAARSDAIETLSDKLGESALAVETDVRDLQSVESSIRATEESFGGLDCLVNNAGIAGPTALVDEVAEDEWTRTLDVNVTGYFRTVKAAASALRRSDNGRIINVSSISGKRPLANRTPYVASKMAVIGLTRTLAVEFGPDDVTVNAICPGPTNGPRLEAIINEQAKASDRTPAEIRQDLFLDDSALGTVVDPDDIAELVVFLSSDAGQHITAQDINVDAGTIWY
jgi:NAD(P)-dependent dehydrogenase (short-subunit alcohol dehydrogenase family)